MTDLLGAECVEEVRRTPGLIDQLQRATAEAVVEHCAIRDERGNLTGKLRPPIFAELKVAILLKIGAGEQLIGTEYEAEYRRQLEQAKVRNAKSFFAREVGSALSPDTEPRMRRAIIGHLLRVCERLGYENFLSKMDNVDAEMWVITHSEYFRGEEKKEIPYPDSIVAQEIVKRFGLSFILDLIDELKRAEEADAARIKRQSEPSE